MNRFKNAAFTVALASGLTFAGSASALTWFEMSPGAGDTTATAQITVGPGLAALDSIVGSLQTIPFVDLGPQTEVDLYKIYVSDAPNFFARTVSSTPDDTALFLFDDSGRGVYTNDDSISNLLAALPWGVAATNGYYYLAVSLGGFQALDGSGQNMFFPGGFTDVLPGDPVAGPLASWDATFATAAEGALPYTILLGGASVAMVPEPASALMLLLGLAGLAGVAGRRLPKQRKQH